jgi:hypothetical protein
MKCNKCGSYEIKHYLNGKIKCCKCNEIIRTIKEHKYQQRLDKVLSKFDDKTKKWKYLEYHLGYEVYMQYVAKTFYLQANNCEHILSLDTVESLIKDLEETK